MSDMMVAVEFQTRVKDGTIEVPEQYRDQVYGVVRVIILRTDEPKKSKIIERLVQHPIQDPTFQPLTRAAIYTRSPSEEGHEDGTSV
ncbi:hypothetical protein EYB53_006105 [Candidatus Chloroploca sp. M-50]|uniref:Uncharacterized protein n=1 Tax=Candidatus Chloroploca mongolica TaxID=2528176 RepID=A0ABS4D781_9CHLR|nr:hypothetical protein [Candidatus Chloroploca mongolica]MBP1465275.1 hypothetical protein [Candidatus Chloroploca mongolica]